MDSFGDHALSCSSSNDRIARHNDTRDLVFHACRSAGLSPVLEAKGLSDTSHRRPGDVFIPNWKHGSPAAVDVTLTCPLQSTVINRAAEEVGYACKLAEERKFAASAQLCEQSGIDFIPLAMETSGGFGSRATSFLTVLAERCADNNMRDRIAEKRELFQRINVAIHRSNANMLLSRITVAESEPLSLGFHWENIPHTASKRLRDGVSEEGPFANGPQEKQEIVTNGSRKRLLSTDSDSSANEPEKKSTGSVNVSLALAKDAYLADHRNHVKEFERLYRFRNFWEPRLNYEYGNLFSSSQTLAHCVSEDMEMSAGIAAKFVENFGDIQDICCNQNVKKGGVAIYEDRTNKRFIYNLVTKKILQREALLS